MSRKLQQALGKLSQDIRSSTEGTGVEVKVAVVDLWCGLEPDDQGRLAMEVRTDQTPVTHTPHRFQIALTPTEGGARTTPDWNASDR